MIKHQSRFSRTQINEGKMGAYYTDVSHCRDIGKMFKFPNDEVCVLEPSIGDGSAVIALTNADSNPNVKIFGVELNDEVAHKTAENEYLEDVLCADFLDGVRIKNSAFSMCFSNPPYLNDNLETDFNHNRIERQFLEKIGYYLQKGGILVWVVPYYIFTEESHFRYFNSKYELKCVYKFREKEFDKYHQIVAVGVKRGATISFSKDRFAELREPYNDLEKISELPFSFAEEDLIPVPATDSNNITLFASKQFDLTSASEAISASQDICRIIDESVSVPRYVVNSLGRPPMPLKKDSLYLLATSGAGQGITGSVETGDLHLQRGVAEIIEESTFESNGDGTGKGIETVTSRTQISMTVIQNSGRIDRLI